MQKFKQALKQWLGLGVTILLLSGLMYVLLQQQARMKVNEVPNQLASELARTGSLSGSIVPYSNQVELAKSELPFVIKFNNNKQIVASTATLNGKPVNFPTEILSNVTADKSHSVTWQPQSGVREAAVVYRSQKGDGWVVAGQSLKATEAAAQDLLMMTVAGCLITLLTSFVAVFVFARASSS